MIKPLEKALEAIARLPAEEQELAADLLQQFAARSDQPYVLQTEERTAINEALAEADRADFASQAELQAALQRSWR